MKSIKILSTIYAVCLLPLITEAQQKPANYHLLIGTYTSGTSEGIYVYKFNAITGEFKMESKVPISNPSFLAISANQKYVYSVQEESDKSQVSAFGFDPIKGTLKFLNSQPSGGAHPCHVSVDPTGKKVFVANYTGGSLSAFTVLKDGSLDANIQTVAHNGSSINKQRQEKPHIHQVFLSPDEKYVITPDLGTDRVTVYPIDINSANPIRVKDSVSAFVEPGGGPRHIAFHPNGKYAYLTQELTGKITAYTFTKGKLSALQTVSLLADKYEGEISAADIHLSPEGKFLYASSRGNANELVIFAVNPDKGTLKYVARQSALGKKPRNFAIDPTGTFLLVANQDSNNIVIFKRDTKTGLLKPTGKTIEVSKPVCVIFTPAK